MDCEKCEDTPARVAVAPVERNRGVVDSTEYVCTECAWSLIKHEGYREAPVNTHPDATAIVTDGVTRIGNEDGEVRTNTPANLSENE